MATRKFEVLTLLATLVGSLSGCAWSGYGWGGAKQASALNNPPASLAQPSKPSWGSSLASALTIKPKVTPAEDPLKVNGKQGPMSAEFFLSAAHLYENRGDFDAAGGQYRKALDVAPKNLAALVGYARLQDRQNKFDEATKLYRRAIVAHPQSATAYNDLGLCLARHGQPEAALESMQKSVQLDPANKLYRNNISAVLVDMGRSREAYDHLVLAHGEAAAHYNLGYMLFQRDKSEQATQQFALAVEKDPSLAQARDMLNRTSGLAGREIVQKTQHVSDPLLRKPAEKRSDSPFQVSPAFPSAEMPPGAAPQPTYLPREAPPSAARRSSVRPLTREGDSLKAVSADDMPVHDFSPVRLPEAVERRDDGQFEPAPLPDSFSYSTGIKARTFPSGEGNE